MNRSSAPYPPDVTNHFEDPFHRGVCEGATHGAQTSSLAISLRVDEENVIEEAWFDAADDVVLTAASASMLMERIEGMTLADARNLLADDVLGSWFHELSDNDSELCRRPFVVLRAAIDGQDSMSDNDPLGPHFAGPHLGDES